MVFGRWLRRFKLLKKLKVIQRQNRTVSSLFASHWGQQNHPEIRLLSYETKKVLSELINSSVNTCYKFYQGSAQNRLDEFKNNGFVVLDNILSQTVARSVREEFEKIDSCFAWHVPDVEKPLFSPSTRTNEGYGSFKTEEVISNETLLEVLLNEEVLDLVEGYLGAPGRLFHLNTYWSFASKNDPGVAQTFHRDQSHVKFCVLFVYLTDVDEHSGPHEYIKYTHDKKILQSELEDDDVDAFFDLAHDGYGKDDLYNQKLSKFQEAILGPAGTCVLTDPTGLHRGIPPSRNKRLMAWGRYAVIPNEDKIGKVVPRNWRKINNLTDRQLYTLSSMLQV